MAPAKCSNHESLIIRGSLCSPLWGALLVPKKLGETFFHREILFVGAYEEDPCIHPCTAHAGSLWRHVDGAGPCHLPGGAVSRGNLKRIKKNDLILFCRCFMGSKGD